MDSTVRNHMCPLQVAGHSLILLSLLACRAYAVPRTWDGGGSGNSASDPTNWVADVAPVEGDSIVLDTTSSKNMTWDLATSVASWFQVGYQGTVTVATVYGTVGFTNFNISGDCIISNGVWTHVPNPNVNYEVNRLRATIGGNLIIGSNAAINVEGRGYRKYMGPGYANAASHGGQGGTGYLKAPALGPCYGSIVSPTNLGSGGSWDGSFGGGAIYLTVLGTVTDDGSICANAAPWSYNTGAGGSIFITAGAFSGTGAVRADGGDITGHSAGGGGRIALVVTNSGADFSNFTGPISTYGTGGNGYSHAGTIYLETSANDPGRGELIIDNSGGSTIYGVHASLSHLEPTTYSFSRIILTNNAILNIGPNDTLVATNTVIIGNPSNDIDGITISGGTLTTPGSFAFSNIFIRVDTPGSTFSPVTSLIVGTNALLVLDKPHDMACDLIVAAGGKVTHTANPSSAIEYYKIDLTLRGNMTVSTGGSVDVAGRGFPIRYGPGNNPAVGNCGASYGGRGLEGLECYGSIVAPVNLGSGGSGWDNAIGGGAVRLNITGQLSNQGGIYANARTVNYRTGSGGSIYITAGTMTGSGPVQANSASAQTGDHPGGGGRIALAVTNAGADFSSCDLAAVQAHGARKVTGAGGAGTVYLRTADQGLYAGTLIVDNGGLSGLETEISSNVTDAAVADVFIRNNAHLSVAPGQTLTLSGTWSNAASFTGYSNSTVAFDGGAASTSRLYGATTFTRFFCTNGAGKTLVFPAGLTNSISAGGKLRLLGHQNSTNLFLRSSSDGVSWKLNVGASVDQAVQCVNVKDSDAMPGVTVIALNSKDSTANSNWVFYAVVEGDTNTWTGYGDTVWSASTNWSLGRPPVDTDFILIPASCPRYPVLDDARTVNGIEIESGASLALAGFNLTAATNATIAGQLAAADTETLTFRGNLNFSGGSFTPAQSTVALAGDAAQAIDLNGLTFHNISLQNSSATMSFTDGFTAKELRCEAPGGTRSIDFLQASTVALRDLVMWGSAAATNITLRSSNTGQQWNLVVSGYRSVRGVDVQDSDAGMGLPIPADSSKDSTGNDNWVFTPSWAEWMGTNSSSFHDAANWSPAAVPDASARVVVQTANAMIISSPATVLDLTVGGGSETAAVTVNAPFTVAENAVVMDGGILAMNKPSVISNGVYVLPGGTLTHSENGSTEVNKLDLTIHGDLSVDMGGAIDVTGKGYAIAKGPGIGTTGGYYGSSHGGVGGDLYAPNSGPCYGSIVAPTNLGSGGARERAGGGAVLLSVDGDVCNNGLICASGPSEAGYGGGSGGSIRITAATLCGVGAMRANGSSITSYGQGGGGRIALVLTKGSADFSAYTGSIEAYSGKTVSGNAYHAGAGTIYMQTGDEGGGRGIVLIDNNNATDTGYTGVPPGPYFTPGETDRARFSVSDAAELKLTDDFSVGNILLTTANAVLNLASNTLTVDAAEHALTPGTVTNYGEIVWIIPGTVFVIQ